MAAVNSTSNTAPTADPEQQGEEEQEEDYEEEPLGDELSQGAPEMASAAPSATSADASPPKGMPGSKAVSATDLSSAAAPSAAADSDPAPEAADAPQALQQQEQEDGDAADETEGIIRAAPGAALLTGSAAGASGPHRSGAVELCALMNEPIASSQMAGASLGMDPAQSEGGEDQEIQKIISEIHGSPGEQ